jgi:hypothetical protein
MIKRKKKKIDKDLAKNRKRNPEREHLHLPAKVHLQLFVKKKLTKKNKKYRNNPNL